MILLDTCALLWLSIDQQQLTAKAKQLIEKYVGNLYVSSISACEIGVKCSKGLLKLSSPALPWFQQALEWHGIIEIPVDSRIAVNATLLPLIHRDPADRIIVATALEKSLSILTPDRHIHAYGEQLDLKVIW